MSEPYDPLDADLAVAREAAWAALEAHGKGQKSRRIDSLFADNEDRFQQFSRCIDGLLVDFSRSRLSQTTVGLLEDLVAAANVAGARDSLFDGQAVNSSEGRSARHAELRAPDAAGEFSNSLEAMLALATAIRSRDRLGVTGKPLKTMVHLGIGGSELGPRAVVSALAGAQADPRVHFVGNMDGHEIAETLAELDPETTHFTLASKSFGTEETLTNGVTARSWLEKRFGDNWNRQMIAITASQARARAFGFDDDGILTIPESVGGRFSLWSAVGLPVAVAIGVKNFRALLEGARIIDENFLTAPFRENLAMLLGAVDAWNGSIEDIDARAIIAYDARLRHLPPHLQQLEMESLGKRVGQDGSPVNRHTAPIVFGGVGSDAQHGFFQALHQGTRRFTVEFIGCARPGHDLPVHHERQLANLIAQGEALMHGYDGGKDSKLSVHKALGGDHPSTTIMLDSLTPRILGMLLALYEHRVFVNGVLWGINPFDQWGVERGKKLAGDIERAIVGYASAASERDPASAGMIEHLRRIKGNGA